MLVSFVNDGCGMVISFVNDGCGGVVSFVNDGCRNDGCRNDGCRRVVSFVCGMVVVGGMLSSFTVHQFWVWHVLYDGCGMVVSFVNDGCGMVISSVNDGCGK